MLLLSSKISLDDDDIVLYAYIGQILDLNIYEQDYEPFNLCMTLTTIDEKTFNSKGYNNKDGCNTFILDLKLGLYSLLIHSSSQFNETPLLKKAFWVKIIAKECEKTKFNAYFYKSFNELDSRPTYIKINHINYIESTDSNKPNEIELLEDNLLSIKNKKNIPPEFYSFHVGQGMCSLMKIGNVGIIFDIGAGKPIQRQKYKNTHNELTNNHLNVLDEIYIIISHLDKDHWRLMEWEISKGGDFLDKIKLIIVPNSENELSFKNKKIVGKVQVIKKTNEIKGNGFLIKIHRSKPSKLSNNNDCLVCEVEINDNTILIPGDYVYKEMSSDSNIDIKMIPTKYYDLIIVPHHGDEASAINIPNPVIPSISKAYFSAGTHCGYKHPRQQSIDEHRNNNFDTISDNTCNSIKVAVSVK